MSNHSSLPSDAEGADILAKNTPISDPEHALNITAQTNSPVLIDPSTTDALLEVVSQQIELLTFDPEDTGLLNRLIESCGDQREEIQLRLVALFGEIGEDATPVLIAALSNHTNAIVRRVCAKALAKLGDADAIPVLIQALLKDPDPITQSSASGALARMGTPAIPGLLEVIASPSYPDAQKGQAAWALSCLGAEAAEELYGAAKSEIPDVRCAVIGAIAAISKPQTPPFHGIQLLLNALQDPVSAVRLEAASGLGKLSHYNATHDLIPLLTDSDPEVRKTTALALGSLKDARALNPLEDLKMDPSDSVRSVVHWAIQQLQS